MLHIAFDLETTGRKKTDQITQIGCTTSDKQFITLVRPTIPICDDSVRITGISDKDVQNAPELAEALEQWTHFFQELPNDKERALIAYNGKEFDIPILVHELRRIGKDPTVVLSEWKITYFVDPFAMSKQLLDTTLLEQNERGDPCYKLESIYHILFHEPLTGAHNALQDAKGLLRLLDLPLYRDALSKFLQPFMSLVKTIPKLQNATTKNKTTTVHESNAFVQCMKRAKTQ